MRGTQTTWRRFFFSPNGRFNRGRYWGATALTYGVMALCVIPLMMMDYSPTGSPMSNAAGVYAVFVVVALIALTVAHVFTTVKRFHDRDKRWPWLFIGLIPYIGGLWILVECDCLRGTPGRNRFGADPLNPEEDDILAVFDAPTLVPAVEPKLPAHVGAAPQDRMYR